MSFFTELFSLFERVLFDGVDEYYDIKVDEIIYSDDEDDDIEYNEEFDDGNDECCEQPYEYVPAFINPPITRRQISFC
jgi:hypothetical protein